MADVVARSEFSLLADLAHEGALTSTALTLDPATSYETWEALGAMLGALSRSACWAIGDWLNFGERVYGETYAQGAEATGLSPGSLMHYAWVAGVIPPERRRPAVSFSSHRTVAPLEPAEQDEWLDKAEDNGWSQRELAANLAARPESSNGGGVKRGKIEDDLEEYLSEIKKLFPKWEPRFVDSCSGKAARRRVKLAEEVAEWLTKEYVPAHAALVTPLAKVPT